MILSNSVKLRLAHGFNHIALLVGVFSFDTQWWMWGIALLVWNFIGTIGISIGFHRLLSHRSFFPPKWFVYASSFVGCLATGGSPLSWVGSHRMHHAHPDKESDPHSPVVKGRTRIYFHLWGKVNIPRRMLRDLLQSKYQKFLHRHYFLILAIWATALYLIHPLVGLFVYSVPAVIAFHSFGLINTLCHGFGYRNFQTADSSSNNWFVNLWTCGEGWHNNHHYRPSSYRIGVNKYEFDISARVIELLGLAKTSTKVPKVTNG